MKNKKVKLAALCLGLVFTMVCPLTAMASPTSRNSKYSSEFGTLQGKIEYIGVYFGRKDIHFETTTTKTAYRVIAKVDVLDYKTGERLDGDYTEQYNSQEAMYTCDCHSPAANSRKISAFGTHEARGKGSCVVYTSFSGV